jgi:hypothetical protein
MLRGAALGREAWLFCRFRAGRRVRRSHVLPDTAGKVERR